MESLEKTNWSLVFLLLLAGLFAAAQFGKLTLTLGVLQQHYPDGGVFVPLLVSTIGFVGIALGAVAGSVVAALGLSRVLVLGLLTGGALSLLQTSLPSLPVFALLRVAEGVSHLAIVVATPTSMASIANDADRPFVMGIWAAFFGISMAVLAVILPSLLAFGGLPLVLAFHGAGMIVMGVWLWRVLPRSDRSALPRVRVIEDHRVIYSHPRLLIPGASFVCYTMIYIALLGVLPLARDLPQWSIAAFPIISIFGTVLGGWVAKFVAPDQVVAAGFVATIFATGLSFVLSDAIWPLFVLFLMMAFIPAGSFAAIPHFNYSQADRARATGGLAQLGNVGTSFGTPLFALAQLWGGFGLMCVLAALCCLLGLAMTRALAGRIK
ncbi:MAG: MFS transporter [Pseudomonadota bacterium]